MKTAPKHEALFEIVLEGKVEKPADLSTDTKTAGESVCTISTQFSTKAQEAHGLISLSEFLRICAKNTFIVKNLYF